MSEPHDKSDRVYLRINKDLKEKMQRYCDRKGTNMSSLVTEYFSALLKTEDQNIDAEQF